MREGWFEDPTGRHAYRWYSVGAPTDLVMDGRATDHDPIDKRELARLAAHEVRPLPDTGPLLHHPSNTPLNLELLNFGSGPVRVINANGDDSGEATQTTSFSAVEAIALLLLWPAALLLAVLGVPMMFCLALIISSALAVVALRLWRRSRSQR